MGMNKPLIFTAALMSAALVAFPSPHSGILFLFPIFRREIPCQGKCFRPLIRGFFFYKVHNVTIRILNVCFRPLIRGFFFYYYAEHCLYGVNTVSVPSFGDSFFIVRTINRYVHKYRFPSPHSGILFLLFFIKHILIFRCCCFRPCLLYTSDAADEL